MNNKIIKRVGIGILLYAVFVIAVLNLYPDTPQDMNWKDREEYNRVKISKLKLGLQKTKIIELLGSPDITEAKRINGKEFQVMFYRTQHMQADGITTQNECTPLLFEDNELVAWGEGTYQTFIDG